MKDLNAICLMLNSRPQISFAATCSSPGVVLASWIPSRFAFVDGVDHEKTTRTRNRGFMSAMRIAHSFASLSEQCNYTNMVWSHNCCGYEVPVHLIRFKEYRYMWSICISMSSMREGSHDSGPYSQQLYVKTKWTHRILYPDLTLHVWSYALSKCICTEPRGGAGAAQQNPGQGASLPRARPLLIEFAPVWMRGWELASSLLFQDMSILFNELMNCSK